MFHSVCRRACRFSASATFCMATLPVCAQTAAGGSPSSSSVTEWTPTNWIALITSLTSAIVAIVGALRGTAAQTKSNANEQRLNSVDQRMDAHGKQITDIATLLPSPGQAK